MGAIIHRIEYYLPKNKLTNEDLVQDFPDWSVDKIFKKTGIKERRISSDGQTALDLAVEACKTLFSKDSSISSEIDYIVLCTQSPDYKLPTTACLLQDKLGLKTTVGAVDINQGCSGFVYGLGLAKGLIDSNQAHTVLVITTETYSKYINDDDKSVRTLFGDGAAATVVKKHSQTQLNNFAYATDGAGACNLIVEHGGSRTPIYDESFQEYRDSSGNTRSKSELYMNGAEVFTFTLTAVNSIMKRVLNNNQLTIEDIDHFVFHQPNKFMLDQIAINCGIPKSKLHRNYELIGNTVSSTIPILLKDLEEANMLKSGHKILICGFGVGYSAAGAVLSW